MKHDPMNNFLPVITDELEEKPSNRWYPSSTRVYNHRIVAHKPDGTPLFATGRHYYSSDINEDVYHIIIRNEQHDPKGAIHTFESPEAYQQWLKQCSQTFFEELHRPSPD